MRTEKLRKSVKGTALKIIIAVFLTWILLAVTDLIRFATSDGYIQPLFTVTQMACKCGVSVTALTIVISLTLTTIHENMTRKNLIPDVFLSSDTPYIKKSENNPTPKKRHSVIIKVTVVATVLPIIYIILSLINIYNVDISTSIFHETYEFWKDSTYFDKLHSSQIESYIYSIIFVIPYIIMCIISIFSEKLKGKKKLRYSVISFLIFLFSNYINMDEVHQSTCSDDFMMIGLVSKLQNILMWLNIASFLLICCTAVIEIRTTNKNKSKKL